MPMPLNSMPARIDGYVRLGEGASFAATNVDEKGRPTDWPEAPVFHVGALNVTATVLGSVATWVLNAAQVAQVATAERVPYSASVGVGDGLRTQLTGYLLRLAEATGHGGCGFNGPALVVVGPALGAPYLVLGPGDPIPDGTAPGTVVLRTV